MTVTNLKEAFKSAKTTAEIRTVGTRVMEHIRAGTIKKESLSLRNIAEATLGSEGLARLGAMSDEGSLSAGLKEAVDPVNLSAFTNITGELIIQTGYEAYRKPEFVGDKLVTAETSRDDNTRVRGLSLIDDDVLVVKEGGEYPDTKFGEDYIDIPQSQKRGMKIGLTREMVFFDRTNELTTLAQSIGERLGVNKERRILQVVLGITNTFSRKGIARNTYVASADPRINAITGITLTDWTTFDTLMQMFQAYTDDRTTGEPITVTPNTVVCCPGKLMTVNRILDATAVNMKTNTLANETLGGNPLAGMKLGVISSQWISFMLQAATSGVAADNIGAGLSATNANDTWLFGNPRAAFRYRTLFPFALRSAQHDKDDFERDVVMQWRCDERGVPYVYAPWHVIRVKNA